MRPTVSRPTRRRLALASADKREGEVAPTVAQQRAAKVVGATAVRWNQFGTPRILLDNRGYLSGARGGSAGEVARALVADTPISASSRPAESNLSKTSRTRRGGPLYQAAANPSDDPVFSNPDCDSEEQTPDRALHTPSSDMVWIAEL